MFPGVYGFTWDAGNIIFLGIFFTVAIIIASTVTLAALRAIKDFKLRKHEAIRWHEDFHDLPASLRACRHDIAGDVAHRVCPNGFDCRICETHPKLLEMRRQNGAAASDAGSAEPALGFDMPLNRMYHRGHTWVEQQPDGTALVGLDDFGTRLLGTPDAVDLPAVGEIVHTNGTGWKMTREGNPVRILAPVDGQVLETGGPDTGWYLKLKAPASGFDTRHLLAGCEVRPWLTREMERLQLFLGSEGLGPVLADGGEPVKDFTKTNPNADWDGVWGAMFLEP